jgi:hypothetical protein
MTTNKSSFGVLATNKKRKFYQMQLEDSGFFAAPDEVAEERRQAQYDAVVKKFPKLKKKKELKGKGLGEDSSADSEAELES